MSKQHTDYYSHILGLSLPVEVTGHYGYPVIMFPTSQGNYTQNSDFLLTDSVKWLTDSGKIKIYNVQTIDNLSLYNKNIPPQERIRDYELFIQFLVKEYIPYIQKLHQTHRVAVAGASFGAYHAANFAFRFPDLVSHMISLSGAFSIRSFMDGYSDDLVYLNCPREQMHNAEPWKFGHMHIVLSTSDEDICLHPTREMAGILTEKGINHWYDEQKWIKHDWHLWKMMFPVFMGRFFS